MGRKKRLKPSSSSSSATAAASPAAVGVKAASASASSLSHGSPDKEAKNALGLEAIEFDCDRAFEAFRRGNHHKALKLMKKFCLSYPNSGFVHTLQGTMYYQLAHTIVDPSTKLQYLKTAADSAGRATLLSPDYIDFAHFYAHLLYLTSENNDGYQEVVRECERALSIPPEKASLHDGRNQSEGSIPMAQISELQDGLRSLIGTSNETVKNGVTLDVEAKFMLHPFSDLLKESKLVSLKHSEDDTELKDLEEREKEIKAKLQQVDLLQRLSAVSGESQRGEVSQQNYLKDVVPESSSSRSSHKLEERKRLSNLKKMKDLARMMPHVRMYWDSISVDEKRKLLNVGLGKLIEYFGSSETVEAPLIFCEAISYANDSNTWKFMGCCFCNLRFKELIPYLRHLEVKHLGNFKDLAPEMMFLLPLQLKGDWVEMLLKDRWRPVDTFAALKMIENGSEGGESSRPVGGNIESHEGEVDDENIEEMTESGSKGGESSCPVGGDRESHEGEVGDENIKEMTESGSKVGESSRPVGGDRESHEVEVGDENIEEMIETGSKDGESSCPVGGDRESHEGEVGDENIKKMTGSSSKGGESSCPVGGDRESHEGEVGDENIKEMTDSGSKGGESSCPVGGDRKSHEGEVDDENIKEMTESGSKGGESSRPVGGDRESHEGEVGDENIKEGDGEKGLPFDQKWPFSDDSERAKMLSKIHVMFKLLHTHNYLSERLLKVLVKYSLEKLQTLVPELEPLIQGLEQTPLCMCFLHVPQLKYVYNNLEEWVRLCGLDFHLEQDGFEAETPSGGFDIKHRIGLSSKSVSLLLDKHSAKGEVDFFTYHDTITDDASSVAFTVDNLEDDALPDSDSLAAWLFEGPSNEEQVKSWVRALQDKKYQAIEILSVLEKQFSEYKSFCSSKLIHVRQEEAFQAVENILAEELTKRAENSEVVPQCFEDLLKKRQEELANKSNDKFSSDAAELTFISNVLKGVEALSLKVRGNSGDGTSQLSDQESAQEEDSKVLEDLLDQNSLLEMVIQDQKEEVSLKICEIDTSIMRCVVIMRNLELTLGKVSLIDYRAILWVILTSYLRDHLMDLAKEYATKMSDAIGQALILEAALDTQKNINTADDNTKKTQKKSKKKKSKSNRDAKDSKATGGTEQLLISDSPKSVTAVSVSADELKQQEEESRRHELEVQAQSRKLEEYLEYQRQFESESRQKQLTGQIGSAGSDEQVSQLSDNENVELKQEEEESRSHELELQEQERKPEEKNRGAELDEPVSPHPDNQNVELEQQEEELEPQAQERKLEEKNRGAESDEQVSPHPDNQNVELKQQEEELEPQAQERKLEEQNRGEELDEQVSPHPDNQNVELKQREEELEPQAQERKLEEQNRGAELDEQVSPHPDNQNVELKQQEEELELQTQERKLEEQSRGAELDEQVSPHPDNQNVNEELKQQEEELELQTQERKLEEQSRGAELDEKVSPRSDNQNVEFKQQKEESMRLELELRAQEGKLFEILGYQRQIDSGGRQKQLTGQSPSVELDEQVSPLSDNQNEELKRRLELELQAQERDLLENLNYERQIERGGRQKQLTGQSPSAELDDPGKFTGRTDKLPDSRSSSSSSIMIHRDDTQKKSKKKKKNNRDAKDPKATGGTEQLLISDPPKSETAVSVGADELKQQEEESRRHELELQAQSRKGREYVEYPRQFESGSRQKRLTGQRQSAELDEQVSPKKFTRRTGMLPDSSSNISSSNKEKRHPDLSVGEYKEPKVLPSAPLNTLDTLEGSTVSLGSPSSSHGKVEQGLPSGGTSEDTVLRPDKRKSQSRIKNMNPSGVHGTSLKKNLAQYNCFLDVIITSLWHVRWFRNELQRRRQILHAHAGNPCVYCSLCSTFTVLSFSPVCLRKDIVTPRPSRTALSNFYPDNVFFQEAQTTDAISILVGIFDRLHQSFSAPGEKYRGDFWDCTSNECLPHTIIGMDLLNRMTCYNCCLESGHDEFTSFLRMVDESKLRKLKEMYMDSSFDKLLKLVDIIDLLPCDPEAGGCGKLNSTHHFLSRPPHVFITIIDWKTGQESADDLSTTLAALSTEIDLGIPYGGLEEGNTHHLMSLVCFSGKDYHCFGYRHEVEKWIMHNNEDSKVIGCWDEVITVCRTRNFHPLILFFEDEM